MLLWQKKVFFGFDRSKDHSKREYFLGFVLVLSKQQIIVQVRLHSSLSLQRESYATIVDLHLRWTTMWTLQSSARSHSRHDFVVVAARIRHVAHGEDLPQQNAVRPAKCVSFQPILLIRVLSCLQKWRKVSAKMNQKYSSEQDSFQP